METQKGVQVDGTSTVMPECPKCEAKNAKGTYMVREMDKRCIFKCDVCGGKTHMGWLDESHQKMVEAKEGMARATQNRERYRRERDDQFVEEYQYAVENLHARPDVMRHFNETHKGLLLERDRQMRENERNAA